MEYSFQATGESLLFTVHGELTMQNISRLSEGIKCAAASHGCTSVVIMAKGVALIDSAAFGYLIRQNAELAEQGGRISFCGLRPNVQSALTQLHLNETLVPYDSLEDALAARTLVETAGPDSGSL